MPTIKFSTPKSLLEILQCTVAKSNRECIPVAADWEWEQHSYFAMHTEDGNLITSFEKLDPKQMPFKFRISDKYWNCETEGIIESVHPFQFKLTFWGYGMGQQTHPKYTLLGNNKGPTHVTYEGAYNGFLQQELMPQGVEIPAEAQVRVTDITGLGGQTLNLEQYKAHRLANKDWLKAYHAKQQAVTQAKHELESAQWQQDKRKKDKFFTQGDGKQALIEGRAEVEQAKQALEQAQAIQLPTLKKV